MSYQDAIKYLESFINYEKLPFFNYKESFNLERMRRLAERIGNPQSSLKCIHIAGSKGKGSTAAMTASILKEAGFRAGLYTSPHLVSFRERIRLNDELIGREELAGLVNRLRDVISAIDKAGGGYPTFFEVYTALAFLYFKEKKADFCVLEVGLGGRLDATNIIERPIVCGITQLSLEHTDKLGNTLGEIAAEKAGIIKEGSVCVSSAQEESAIDVIRNACMEKKGRLYEVGRDLYFKKEEGRQIFSVSGIFEDYPYLQAGLLGDHQIMNAATAVGLVEALRFSGITVKGSAIRSGLSNVEWPGRLQVLRKDPYIVLDGAQNRASARGLREAIRRYFTYDRLILVLGVSKDKDIRGICEELAPVSDALILTKANIARAEEPAAIKRFINVGARRAVPLHLTDSVREALEAAEGMAGPSGLILVTGSFFVIGEVLRAQISTDAVLSEAKDKKHRLAQTPLRGGLAKGKADEAIPFRDCFVPT